MDSDSSSRRSFLKGLGATGALAASASRAHGLSSGSIENVYGAGQSSPIATKMAESRARRMAWWHEAKFGMFIHWGLYRVIGQHEWAKEVEGVPIPQYEIPRQALYAEAKRCARVGPPGQACWAKVHGDDHQAS